MGCGSISQRSSTAVEVVQPVQPTVQPGGNEGTAAPREQSRTDGTAPTRPSRTREDANDHSRRHQSETSRLREPARPGTERVPSRNAREGRDQANSNQPRRIIARLPGNPQDHAFCFECGAFFRVTTRRDPQCARCGGTFVQFLRNPQEQNWIAADNDNYSFENRIDDTISASLDEAPVPKKPVEAMFLLSLPTFHLSPEDAEERIKLGESDPRCACAICRDIFEAGNFLRQLPCGHEFHTDCGDGWLQLNNTCPICRFEMPEEPNRSPQVGAAAPGVPFQVAASPSPCGAPAEPNALCGESQEPQTPQRVTADNAATMNEVLAEGPEEAPEEKEEEELEKCSKKPSAPPENESSDCFSTWNDGLRQGDRGESSSASGLTPCHGEMFEAQQELALSLDVLEAKVASLNCSHKSLLEQKGQELPGMAIAIVPQEVH